MGPGRVDHLFFLAKSVQPTENACIRDGEKSMRKLFRICLVALAMSVALPVLVRAQTTKFDGTYTGLPSTTSGAAQCPPMETASALTISGGNVQSATGNFTGTVAADGHVVLHSKTALRFEGQIDATGLVKVSGASTHGCLYTFSWQKR
jgi:hypothetical protein